MQLVHEVEAVEDVTNDLKRIIKESIHDADDLINVIGTIYDESQHLYDKQEFKSRVHVVFNEAVRNISALDYLAGQLNYSIAWSYVSHIYDNVLVMKEDGRTKVDIITKMVESYKSITGCTLDRSNKILVAHVVGLISRAYLRPSSFDSFPVALRFKKCSDKGKVDQYRDILESIDLYVDILF